RADREAGPGENARASAGRSQFRHAHSLRGPRVVRGGAMIPRLASLALIAVLALVAGCATRGPLSSADSAAAFERQILLTVRQPDAFAAGLTGAPGNRYLKRRYGATPEVERVLTRLAHEHGVERVDGWPIAALSVYCEVLEVPADAAVDDVIAALAADPRVDLVQRMNVFATEATRYDDP